MASIIPSRAGCIRNAVGPIRTTGLQMRANSSLSSSSTPLTMARIPATQSQRPTIVASQPAPTAISPVPIRYASTAVPPEVLTWNRFFDLRRKRRFLNLGASILTGLGTVATVGPIIAQRDIDSWAAQISGLAPEIALGIVTFTVGAGGWMCGPSFGNAMFKLWAGRRGWNKAIAEKEVSFYARIRRYRADPASSSPQNPLPDYYGEKIGSVKDYRRWLKDQRAFNLKKDKNML